MIRSVQTLQTPAARREALRALSANIHWYMRYADARCAEVARLLGISESTFFRKMDRPELFTYEELVIMTELFRCKLSVLTGGRLVAEG